MSKLQIRFNNIDQRWKVLDQDGFCFGDGETVNEAIKSARMVTNKPIYDGDRLYSEEVNK